MVSNHFLSGVTQHQVPSEIDLLIFFASHISMMFNGKKWRTLGSEKHCATNP